VGLLVEDLERSLAFYQGVLGLEINKGRPDNKLPYAGAWLWIGRQDSLSSAITFHGLLFLLVSPSCKQ
jgi:catechol 2,3-dioxygenase-like lactoylglutathione lyase family enzyme